MLGKKRMVAPSVLTANIPVKKCLAVTRSFYTQYPRVEMSSGYKELV